MGDVLMTTPALRAVRQSIPGGHLALLTSPAGAEVASRIPELDEVIVHRAGWMKAAAEGGTAEGILALVDRLRGEAFDAAIVFTVFSQTPFPAAIAAQLAGIPLVLAHVRENPYALVSDWVRDTEWPEPQRHEVQRQLDLVAAAGYTTADEHLSYRVEPGASRTMRGRLRALGIGPTDPFAVLHPGATAASRRYRPEGFAEAARRLAVEDGWRILITGGPEERPLVERIAADVPNSASLAGALTTDELGALLAAAPVLITNNTGPAHLAAAVGTPVVVLYAQTNLQHTPWGVTSRVLTRDVPCRNCLRSVCPLGHHACLAPVMPDEIVDAAREISLYQGGGRAAAMAAQGTRAGSAEGSAAGAGSGSAETFAGA
jgi:lipopolysaccharide heptosyltransferase II